MRALEALKRVIGNSDRSTQLVAELREGTANQSSLLNEKLNAVILGIENQSQSLNLMLEHLREIRDGISNETKVMQEKMAQLVQGVANQSRLLNEKLSDLAQRIK